MAQADTPDPTRFEQEIDAFASWDAKNSSPDNALLFVGSSSIRFWDTAEAFQGYPVINRGFGGSHITDVLYYFDRVISRFDPSLIIFYCGENDIASGLDPDDVFDDYTELLARVGQAFPDADFLYVSIKPSNSRTEYSDAFDSFNRRVESYNETKHRLHYIDLASPLTMSDGQPDDSLFVDDRLHLNEEGYRQWNEKMWEFLSQNF
jgi:lysophospholipase L1-like esterase